MTMIHPVPHRRDAARLLLAPAQLRDSLAMTGQPWLGTSLLAGMQAALAAMIALPLVLLSPWPDLIGYAALGTLVALFGRFAPPGQRSRIVLYSALWQVAAVAGMSALVAVGIPLPGQLALLALACGVFFFAATTGGFGPPGALIFVFAAGACMGHPATWAEVAQRGAATATTALFALALCHATERLRARAAASPAFPAEPQRPLSHRLAASARIVLACAVALFAASAVGAQHAAWAAMGAVVVLQGMQLHITLTRALQRMAGTLIGGVMVWLILALDPSPWMVIALVGLFQIAVEVVIGANYGVGQVLVTPMALLMTHLAAGSAATGGMIAERMLDTLIGVTVGIVLAVVLSTLDDRAHLARHVAARQPA